MSSELWSQIVTCRDVAGRSRTIRLAILDNDLVLRPPPGEVVRMSIDEIEFVRRGLADGRDELLTRARRLIGGKP